MTTFFAAVIGDHSRKAPVPDSEKCKSDMCMSIVEYQLSIVCASCCSHSCTVVVTGISFSERPLLSDPTDIMDTQQASCRDHVAAPVGKTSAATAAENDVVVCVQTLHITCDVLLNQGHFWKWSGCKTWHTVFTSFFCYAVLACHGYYSWILMLVMNACCRND